MRKNMDLRVKRTRESIRLSFLALMESNDYNKISIQDIANGAYINRNTFYLHYLDKDDLLDKLIDESFGELESNLNANNVNEIGDLTYDTFNDVIINTFKAIENNLKFYEIVFRHDNIPYLNTKFENLIRNHISSGTPNKISHYTQGEDKFYIDYLTVGLVGSIKFWIRNRSDYSIEKMADMIIQIYSKDILALLQY